MIGTAQWLALRTSPRWIPATAGAMAAGAALAAVITGAGTDTADAVLAGLVTGAAVGAAQSAVLGGGPRVTAIWTTATALGWSLGWLTTSQVIVDMDRGHHVFGASGAIVATVLTVLALRAIAGSARGAVAVA